MDSPDLALRLYAGGTATLSGSALDAFGNPLPDEGLSWSASLRHEDGSTELLADTVGNGIVVALPADDGERGKRFLVVALTATDAAGNQRTVERSIRVRRATPDAA